MEWTYWKSNFFFYGFQIIMSSSFCIGYVTCYIKLAKAGYYASKARKVGTAYIYIGVQSFLE